MKKRLLKTSIGIILAVILLSSFEKKTPKVLIIGDSISIGYTPFVQKALEGEMIIAHNPGNAQHTGTGLENIHDWIGDGDWDIIQFNWGLWDLCYRHPDSKEQGKRDKMHGTITWPVEVYQEHLDSLVTILQKETRARLIFVTTTYVPEKEVGRFQEDVQEYNKAALKVMKKHHIQVNNIYKKSIRIHDQYGLGADNVHYNEQGYEKLSELIVPFLKKTAKKL